jgi:hypothetical protein
MTTSLRTPTSAWRRGRATSTDRGTVTAFTVVWLIASLALSGLVLDAGLAVSAHVNAQSVANAAARAGARELDIAALRTSNTIRVDPGKARSAASNWTARTGLQGTVTVTADTVTVTVTTRQPTQLLGLLGIHSIAVHATAIATAITP